ncbi:hypothetical protein PHYPSEUDO_013713 [Phytophthora pseudosyringae]|uniref:Uncharacterized protein n=1 Tax=Phytophthora pseudosyringae TaxID=221518 RepID=A0A8T1V8C3_9STRA|nr:hypothetical protein PHYPSEUDO_013713 [Phytophthora pseudosyringae]
MRWLDVVEKLEPMPPPPAPKARPDTRRIPSPLPRDATRDGDERLTPQCAPVPHTHPLVALSDESARNVKLQREGGGMAIRSSERLFRRQPIATGKRLDPTFLSRDRIRTFTDRQEEAQPHSDNPLAVETEHSSRAIALQLQRQAEEMEKAPVLAPLDEQEQTSAATEASARRHALLQAARRESRWSEEDGENDRGLSMNGGTTGSALARASARKVGKQLNAKWVQSRQDPSNRPRGPLERPEERHLRETLFRKTASDLLRSGVLYDEADAARNATFGPMSRPQLPVVTSGIVGLAGCCFEKYEY